MKHRQELPEVRDDELATALAALDEHDLRQGPDHSYDPDKDPDSVPPWEADH